MEGRVQCYTVEWREISSLPTIYVPVYQVEMLCDLYTGFEPSQLSCLRSLVGKSVAWRADGRGFKSHPRQPIFL